MDYIHNMLEELSSALDSDSSGEESEGEAEKKEVDEDDQAEKAKLPQYVSRFKVSLLVSYQVLCYIPVYLSDQVGKVKHWVTLMLQASRS